MARGLSRAELRELYTTHAPIVFRRALSIVGREADAWDVVQDVFERLMERGDEFRHEARPFTYVYRITTNLSLDALRYRAVREQAGSSQAPEALAPDAPERVEARDLLQALVGKLNDRAATIAALCFVDGLTQQEIADVTHLSRKTVGRELASIRQQAEALSKPLHQLEVRHG